MKMKIDPGAKMDVFRGVGINGRPGAGARVSDSVFISFLGPPAPGCPKPMSRVCEHG